MRFVVLFLVGLGASVGSADAGCPSGNLSCQFDWNLYCIDFKAQKVSSKSLLSDAFMPLYDPQDFKRPPVFKSIDQATVQIDAADFQTDDKVTGYTFVITKEVVEDKTNFKGSLTVKNSAPVQLNCSVSL